MEKNEQLRLTVIDGANTEDGLLYGETFNLTDRKDLQDLKDFVSRCSSKGFSIDKITFNEKMEIQNNEKIIEYLHANDLGDTFNLYGDSDIYAKLPYQILFNSILDIKMQIMMFHSMMMKQLDKNNNPIDTIKEFAIVSLQDYHSCKKPKNIAIY